MLNRLFPQGKRRRRHRQDHKADDQPGQWWAESGRQRLPAYHRKSRLAGNPAVAFASPGRSGVGLSVLGGPSSRVRVPRRSLRSRSFRQMRCVIGTSEWSVSRSMRPSANIKRRADQRRSIARSDIGVDHEVGDAEFVLQRHEDDALRCAGPLPHQHDAGQADRTARAGRIETPRVVITQLRAGPAAATRGGADAMSARSRCSPSRRTGPPLRRAREGAASWISAGSPREVSARRSRGGTSRSIALASHMAARRPWPRLAKASASARASMALRLTPARRATSSTEP